MQGCAHPGAHVSNLPPFNFFVGYKGCQGGKIYWLAIHSNKANLNVLGYQGG
jgi:hypothetical protein